MEQELAEREDGKLEEGELMMTRTMELLLLLLLLLVVMMVTMRGK